MPVTVPYRGTASRVSITNRWNSLTPSQRERFWAKVERSDGCWNWIGYVERRGYGTYSVGHKCYRAHRLAYESVNGPVPDGLQVCHHCDNPKCVNPIHLYAGTHRQNMDDKIRRGRNAGGRKPRVPMTEALAAAIRFRLGRGDTRKAVSRDLQVCRERIRLLMGPKPEPTHCPSGHPYSEANTTIRADRGRMRRVCRICASEHSKDFKRRQRIANPYSPERRSENSRRAALAVWAKRKNLST